LKQLQNWWVIWFFSIDLKKYSEKNWCQFAFTTLREENAKITIRIWIENKDHGDYQITIFDDIFIF
jgi:hypothetical protein